MKPNQTLKNTTNSRVYKLTNSSLVSGCPICSPHKGCNRFLRRDNTTSWKNYRRTQWR